MGRRTHTRPSGRLSVRMLCVREQRAEALGTRAPESKAGSSQVSGVQPGSEYFVAVSAWALQQPCWDIIMRFHQSGTQDLRS